LIEWTSENAKNYDNLEELYGQVIGQWNRYNGHVRNNIGGLYETLKTADQEGVVYQPTPKNLQKDAMTWLQKETFATPKWILNEDIMKLVSGAGMAERIQDLQGFTLNQLLSPDRMMRMIEAEARIGNSTYTLLEMMRDLRTGIWSEISSAGTIDTYRRNLQRSYLERMGWLLEDRDDVDSELIDSDIRPIARGELKALRSGLVSAIPRTRDTVTKYHLEDAVARIDKILDPK